VSRRAKSALNYPALCETAFEQLLSTTAPFVTKKALQVVTTTGPQISATVTAWNNSHLGVGSKIQLAQAADVAGDRGKNITVYGVTSAGAYVAEVIALDGANTTTAVPAAGSTNTFLQVLRVTAATALGAQNVTIFPNGVGENVIGTVLATGSTAAPTLLIPRHYGSFSTGGAYVTDAGWFKTVSAVYNLTDDAVRATNLLGHTAFTNATALPEGEVASAFSVGGQTIYLTTGTGGAKTYEIQGTYIPYQGVLDGSETMELVWVSPNIYTTTSGTSAAPAGATLASRYIPISAKLPCTNAYDENNMTRATVDFAGITEYGGSTAFRASPYNSWYHSSGYQGRPYAGLSGLTLGAASNRRGRVSLLSGTEAMTPASYSLTGAVHHGSYFPCLAKVTSAGTNTNVSVNELLLLIMASTQTAATCDPSSAVDAFKLTSAGIFA
jgi:hypothetical protein